MTVLFRFLIVVYQLTIVALPVGIASLPFMVSDSQWFRAAYPFAAPIVYGACYILTCGLLSLPFRSGIREGKFDRSLKDPVYRRRRLHALCWTSIYYSPGYAMCLAFPTVRGVMLRLFGYRGALDVTFYPDTWIRDLPILQIGSGAYLSNKATIGTNLALKDGRILVEGIQIGAGAMVGHLTMVAAGSCLEDGAEVSHGTACGARVRVGKNAIVHPSCCVDHLTQVGESADVGTSCYLGLSSVIGPGVKVPAGSVIPRRSRIQTQADMDRLRVLETSELVELRRNLAMRIDLSNG